MGHLKSDEFIDLAEGTRPVSSAPHLQACGDCRRQLADLRALMTAAAEVEVPEPSPLFWDHLSARVREAVAAEGALPRESWFHRFALPLSVAACAAMIVVAMVTIGPGLGLRGSWFGPALPVADEALDAPLATLPVLPDDPSLDMVTNLAAQIDWDWDTAVSPGLQTHEAPSDKAVGQLTAGERRELGRLLKEELSRRDGPSN